MVLPITEELKPEAGAQTCSSLAKEAGDLEDQQAPGNKHLSQPPARKVS